MAQYWKSSLWDAVLCAAASIGLALNVFAGYDTPDPRAGSPLMVGAVTVVCVALLFLAGYNRATTVAGIAAGVLAAAAAVWAVRSTGVLSGAATIDESPALFWIVTVATAAVTYLLGRSRLGLVLLTLAGCVMTAAFCFLEYPVSLPAFLLFLAAALVSLLLRVCRTGALRADRGSVRRGRYAVQSVVLVGLSLAMAGGIYAGIVRPLDPPTEELKLITTLQSFQLMEVLGISRRTEIQSPDLTTQQTEDETQSVQDELPDALPTAPVQLPDPDREEDLVQQEESVPAQAITYLQQRPVWAALIAAAVILALLAPFGIKALLRRRWEDRVRRTPPGEQGRLLYDEILRKLRLAGLRRPPGVTLREYVQGEQAAFAPVAGEGGDFLALTEDYQRVVYGCQPLDEREAEAFWTAYRNCRRALPRLMGRPRYALRYFSL